MPDPDVEAALRESGPLEGRDNAGHVPVLRSLLFNVAFYVNIVAWMLAIQPAMLMPRRTMIRLVQAWARSSLVLMRICVGTRAEFRGLERMPPGGFVLAAKHQSLWETFALLTVVDDPTFILKRELMWIPLFGWLAWKAGMIPIDRRGGPAALALMNRRAADAVAAGRQLVIFPEGTRRSVGAPPAYKLGVFHLYRSLGVPCLPVALNSGWFWPRRRFGRRPGVIVAEMLEPIQPGCGREEFMETLQNAIEGASERLLHEAETASDRPIS